jgi:3-oxoacyl-[acyl-carrier protein] reductase
VLLPDRPGLLSGRVALVTGAARGIGLATARVFAQQGASVIMADRDLDTLEPACQELHEFTSLESLTTLPCDVSDENSVRDAFQAIFKRFKRLDILVANAGVLDDALIGMVSTGQMRRVFETNTYGVLYCAQYASRLMARNNGGSMINIASIMGTNGCAGQAVYGGSKAAVVGITKSLAKELAPNNIRVNAIAPGFIQTDMTMSMKPEKFKERMDSIKMQRIGHVDEVAKVALFLASDLSSYVTGQIIGVDGGMLI